jgi:hypothetical protein
MSSFVIPFVLLETGANAITKVPRTRETRMSVASPLGMPVVSKENVINLIAKKLGCHPRAIVLKHDGKFAKADMSSLWTAVDFFMGLSLDVEVVDPASNIRSEVSSLDAEIIRIERTQATLHKELQDVTQRRNRLRDDLAHIQAQNVQTAGGRSRGRRGGRAATTKVPRSKSHSRSRSAKPKKSKR